MLQRVAACCNVLKRIGYMWDINWECQWYSCGHMNEESLDVIVGYIRYGVALVSRIDKMIGRFCKRAL